MNYNTHKEILQQPRVWRETYDVILSRKDEIKAFVDKVIYYLKQDVIPFDQGLFA